eukprot:76742-Rhodomonas_salina.5
MPVAVLSQGPVSGHVGRARCVMCGTDLGCASLAGRDRAVRVLTSRMVRPVPVWYAPGSPRTIIP